MRFVLLLACALLLASPALAADRLVPSVYGTIQAGVTAAADGDRVLISGGDYTESVVMGSSDDNITIEGVSGEDVNWTPAGTSNTGDGNALTYATGTNLTVKNIDFVGTGQHHGIRWDAASDLTVEDCDFSQLWTAIYQPNSGAAGLTMTGGSVASTITSSATFCIGIEFDGPTASTVTGVTFDIDPTGSPSWNRVIHLNNNVDVTFTSCTFVSDGLYSGKAFFSTDNGVDGVIIQACSFTNGDASASLFRFNTAAQDGEGDERVQLLGNTFTSGGTTFLDFLAPTGSTVEPAADFHRNISIVGNIFNGPDGVAGAAGMNLKAVSGGVVAFNKCYNFSGSNASGIGSLGARDVQFYRNELYNCDNGIVFKATGRLTNSMQFGCSVTGNYFSGGAGDGAIKVDNYSGAAAPNDSLLTIQGNVFHDVAVVGAWVDTTDATDAETTIAGWRAELEAESPWALWSLRGYAMGSVLDPDNLGFYRVIGVAPQVRTLGIRGKGLGN